MYIADTALGILSVSPGSTSAQPFISTGLQNPAHIVIDRNNILFIADFGNDAIKMRALSTPTTLATTTVTTIANITRPSCFVIDSHGNLFVLSFSLKKIYKIQPPQTVGVTWSTAEFATGFIYPITLSINSNDTLYVPDGMYLKIITSQGNITRLLPDQPYGFYNDCKGIVVDTNNNIIVTNFLNLFDINFIFRYDAQLNILFNIGFSGSGYVDGLIANHNIKLLNPKALTFYNNNIYFADYGNKRIRRIT